MNTRNIFAKLKNSVAALGVAATSGVIGTIEGFAFTGPAGGALMSMFCSNKVWETMLISAAGIGALGAVEGLGLALAAIYGVKGFSGSYEEMQQEGFNYLKEKWIAFEDRDYRLACICYAINHMVCGGAACLALKFFSSETTWSHVLQQFGAITAGTWMTTWAVTPVVTMVTAEMLAKMYRVARGKSGLEEPLLDVENPSDEEILQHRP